MMIACRTLSRRLPRPGCAQAIKLSFSTSSPLSSTDINLVINAVGMDRLGIVSDVTGMVIEAGGNVGDSQAAKLGSHFGLMMQVTLPNDKLDALKAKLEALPDMNTAIYHDAAVGDDNDDDGSTTPSIAYTGKFLLEGADNPGIVHTMTSALTKHGLSIDKMHTDQDIAPHGGTMLFKMEGVVTAGAPLAAGFDVEKIRTDLEATGDSLNCDVTLQDVK